MTLSGIIHTLDGELLPPIAEARHAKPDNRLDQTVTLRRCALYRKAFRGAAISLSADVLRVDAVASWAKERGITIGVASAHDLSLVRLARIHAEHVVLDCGGEFSAAMRRGRFGRFIVDSDDQIASLTGNPVAGTHRVIVEASQSEELAAETLAHPQCSLAGLHCLIGNSNDAELADAVETMIGKMARITRRHAVVLSCVSLGDVTVAGADGDPRALRRLAAVIDQAVEDGCIRHRYPRPAVTVAPDRSALLPPWLTTPVLLPR